VLLPPPASETVEEGYMEGIRDYIKNPYEGYQELDATPGSSEASDSRLHPKATVVGVTAGGEPRAYPLEAVRETGVVNDTVGDLPIVVASVSTKQITHTLFSYVCHVEGTRLEFETADERHMHAGDSRWEIATGRAVDGPHEGRQLSRANDQSPMFWFAWESFNPETTLYQG